MLSDENGDMHPKDPMTRQEAATILAKTYTCFEEMPKNEDINLFADDIAD